MLAGLLCALVLALGLVVVRARLGAAGEAFASRAPRSEAIAGALVVLLASAPLVWVAPWILGNTPTTFGDAISHARIGADIARAGVPHGWIESYLGGFPFGHHYPPAGWLAIAALVKLGIGPQGAVALLGALALLATPLSAYAGVLRCGARPTSAVFGALFVAWVAPYSPFVGGYEVFLQLGLFSQVLATPICILLASSIARARSSWAPPLLAALAMATHPQLTVATLVAITIAITVAARRAPLGACARAGIAGIAVGAALYGQGIATLQIPFGWPRIREFLHLGFPPERLSWWIADGDLLDQGRTPILTALAAAGAVASLLLVRRPAARGAVVAMLVALVLSVSGFALATTRLGAFVLSFLQPLRMVAIVPIAAAAMIVIAIEEAHPYLCAALGARSGVARFSAAAATALLLLALPNRVDYAQRLGDVVSHRPSAPCGPLTPPGYDRATLQAWLDAQPPDRVWYAHDTSPLRACAFGDGMELAAKGPIATTGAAGAHVGLHWVAFRKIDPDREGALRRAEALGVRYIVRVEDVPIPEGFRLIGEHGSMRLLTHDAPTHAVGVGCIRETWSARDAVLRAELERLLDTAEGADRLLDPNHLVALEPNDGDLQKMPSDDATCDATDARVEERPREPGAFEAVVTTPAPVDVVFRASAFPSWRVEREGAAVGPLRIVAPGFFAVRVPAGEHRLVATASSLPGFVGWLLLAAIVVAACALFDDDRLRALRAKLRARAS